MCSIIPFFRNISEIYDKCATNTEGKVANYIPQVSLLHSSASFTLQLQSSAGEDGPCKVGSEVRGKSFPFIFSLCTVDGQRYSLGDSDDKFSLQSTSMPFTYALR